MKSHFRFAIMLLMICFLPAGKVTAQEPVDTTSLWLIETLDGNTFIGSIVSQTPPYLVLFTETYGEVRIPISQIKLEGICSHPTWCTGLRIRMPLGIFL